MSKKRLIGILWSVAALLAVAAYFASRGEVIDYRGAYRPRSAQVSTDAVSAPEPRASVQPAASASAAKDEKATATPAPAVSGTVAAAVPARSSAPLLAQRPLAPAYSPPADPRLAGEGYVRAPQADAARRKQAAEASGIPDDRHFASACEHDHDLYLAAGKPGLYVCAGLNAQVGPDTDTFTVTTSFPTTETFKLHSRPGASLVIYLDFNGHTTTGTPWNSTAQPTFTTPPYSIDADTANFSASEHAAIQAIWFMMAEDFAAFNVDVTTEAPSDAALLRSSTTDKNYGMRVVFGPDQMATGAGGIAFVGSFSSVRTANPNPCFVFAPQGTTNYKFMAEAASHEVGHTVGLFHDGRTTPLEEYYLGHGTGALSWAPIMGAGYYKDVTQWSKGEYASASQTQDDLAVIATYIPFVADDHGATLATASVLADNVLDAGGVISRGTDIDLIKIGCGRGALSVTSLVAKQSPNLRMRLELLDSAGAVLSTSSALGTVNNMKPAVLNYNITSKGYYYLRVTGFGSGDATTGYTDYASGGRFGMTGTWPIYIPGNDPPVADATGTGPTTVTLNAASCPHGAQPEITFRGLSSTDPDGIIVGYRWDFGDEAGSSSTDGLTTFSYRKPGTYQARLTVTDNRGGTDSVVVPITVNWPATPLPTPASCIATVTAAVTRISNSQYRWGALVRAVDEFGVPVQNAEVTVGWSGALSGSAIVRTNSAGEAVVEAGRYRSNVTGSVTFTVLNVKKPAKPYDSTRNNQTSSTATR